MSVSQSGRNPIPTLQMIATEVGLSRETVSHILGGRQAARYRESTRQKVLAAAEKLKYQPHRGAQTMKSGRSNLIAIVHFGAGIEAAHKSNLAISRQISAAGYDYLAIDMNWFEGCVERTLAEIIRARVEGVIISHIQSVFSEDHVLELTRSGIPVVSINGEQRSGMCMVCDDVQKAFRQLTRHLLDIGHQTIVHLVSASQNKQSKPERAMQERISGFQSAFDNVGTCEKCDEEEFFAKRPDIQPGKSTPTGVTVEQEFRLYEKLEEPVYKFCKRLFETGTLPDAIVCTNDQFAMEVIAAAIECGVRIPGDLAVTGYDNDRIGAFSAFGITTAEQNTEKICSAAVGELIERMRNTSKNVEKISFDSKLIIRSSCGVREVGVAAGTS